MIALTATPRFISNESPNTADQLRSGAPSNSPAGHRAALSLQYGCALSFVSCIRLFDRPVLPSCRS